MTRRRHRGKKLYKAQINITKPYSKKKIVVNIGSEAPFNRKDMRMIMKMAGDIIADRDMW